MRYRSKHRVYKRSLFSARANAKKYFLSKSKKNNRFRGRVILFLLVILIGYLLYLGGNKLYSLICNLSVFTIKTIEVDGMKNIAKTEVLAILPFSEGDNLLKINLPQTEIEIKRLKPELKDIKISRHFHKLKVKLRERTPIAFTERDGRLFGIDFDNSIFPLRGFMGAMALPKINCKTEIQRLELLNFIKEFKPVCGNFFNDIAEIEISDAGDIIFIIRNGAKVFWGEPEIKKLKYKFNMFQKIYVNAIDKYKHLEYVDMTFYDKGRAVVKPV
jgi:cell division protein FtsQ